MSAVGSHKGEGGSLGKTEIECFFYNIWMVENRGNELML